MLLLDWNTANDGLGGSGLWHTYEHTITPATLAAAGLMAYEVSNFARSPEHRSLHNLKYWSHRPYLGLGPSAHSFRGHRRWWNLRKIGPWRQRLRHEKDIASDLSLVDGNTRYVNPDFISITSSAGQSNVSYVALYSASISGSLLWSGSCSASPIIADGVAVKIPPIGLILTR